MTVPSFSAKVSAGKWTSAFWADAVPNIETLRVKFAAPIARAQPSGSSKSRTGSTSQRITASSSPLSRASRISAAGRPAAADA